MTLQQLQYIIALDTHRHFVKAAESCFVAQPTLTLQVKKLEEEMGIVLFDRTAQPLKPTAIGIEFIEKARVILRDVNVLKEMVSQEKDGLTGQLRLGIIPTLAPYLLPLLLKDFKEELPDLQLIIKEMQSEEIISALKKDILDIGVMVTPLEDTHIREIILFYEPFLVYASEQSALYEKESINADDIKLKELWLLNQGHCFRNQVLNLCNSNKSKNIDGQFFFESGSIETLKNLVKNNYGYTLIPELAVQKGIDEHFIRYFAEPVPVREVSLVVHQSFSRKLLLKKIQDKIYTAIPERFKKDQDYMKVNWR